MIVTGSLCKMESSSQSIAVLFEELFIDEVEEEYLSEIELNSDIYNEQYNADNFDNEVDINWDEILELEHSEDIITEPKKKKTKNHAHIIHGRFTEQYMQEFDKSIDKLYEKNMKKRNFPDEVSKMHFKRVSIDVKEAFGLKSVPKSTPYPSYTRIEEEVLITAPNCKRTTKGVEFLTCAARHNIVNSSWEGVVDLFTTIGQHVLIMIILLLAKNPIALEKVIKTLLQLRPTYYYRIQQQLSLFKASDTNTVTLPKVLYMKDKILLSDKKYFELTNKLNLISYLPGKTILIQFRK